jgi:lipopolysaccharide export LptBFGC system permease protein LptF
MEYLFYIVAGLAIICAIFWCLNFLENTLAEFDDQVSIEDWHNFQHSFQSKDQRS